MPNAVDLAIEDGAMPRIRIRIEVPDDATSDETMRFAREIVNAINEKGIRFAGAGLLIARIEVDP